MKPASQFLKQFVKEWRAGNQYVIKVSSTSKTPVPFDDPSYHLGYESNEQVCIKLHHEYVTRLIFRLIYLRRIERDVRYPDLVVLNCQIVYSIVRGAVPLYGGVPYLYCEKHKRGNETIDYILKNGLFFYAGEHILQILTTYHV